MPYRSAISGENDVSRVRIWMQAAPILYLLYVLALERVTYFVERKNDPPMPRSTRGGLGGAFSSTNGVGNAGVNGSAPASAVGYGSMPFHHSGSASGNPASEHSGKCTCN